jgi:hypothetical protein
MKLTGISTRILNLLQRKMTQTKIADKKVRLPLEAA